MSGRRAAQQVVECEYRGQNENLLGPGSRSAERIDRMIIRALSQRSTGSSTGFVSASKSGTTPKYITVPRSQLNFCQRCPRASHSAGETARFGLFLNARNSGTK